MIAFVCAFYSEAKYIIDTLNLKKRDDRFPIFANDHYVLILSGIGKIRASIASTYLLSKFRVDFIINYGIAAADFEADIGETFLINKIVDFDTMDEIFPDMIVDMEIKESQICSLSKIVESKEGKSRLLDMESYGFAKAAMEFLSPHQVLLFKVVSDHCNPESITKELIDKIVKQSTNILLDCLEKLKELKRDEAVLSEQESEILENLIDKHKFSISQQKKLQDLFIYKKLKDKTDFSTLLCIEKSSKNRAFEMVFDELF